jgi:thymidylate kinase
MSSRGQIVALLGPDGSGKSTVIHGLVRLAVQGSLYDAILHFHWRPGLLPQLSVFGRRGAEVNADAGRLMPHRAPPASVTSSWVRVTYYACDYVAAWPLLLFHRWRGALIMFDRYFDDFIVDPVRTRVHPATRAPQWLSHLMPQPDKVIVLDCDPAVAYARKPELSLDETNRQLSVYRELSQKRRSWHVVDAGRSADEVLDQVCRIVFGG